MSRKKARESAMSLLFEMEIKGEFKKDTLDIFLENYDHTDAEKIYIRQAGEKIIENIDLIDGYIESNLTGWRIDRLAKVDLSVLRIAIYEILYREDIPVEVSINEAIEIVKKYSAEDSYRFINGVLGGIVKSIERNS